eukprot:TRINITY_DN11493_c0_g1_i4.p1 TRINITY_DN11493_c0_g1~~TRINITY_DN11493_c0_g1_i4.p1  ORF type:complete len:717 (+),score=151.08 TRINITY_DN11493_c0_g1_i4:1548-3698(+)
MASGLNLTVLEYYRASGLAPKSLRILPSSSGNADKIIVGDQDGVLTVLGVKRGIAQSVFTTLGGPAVNRIELLKDRIFIAAKAEVKGFSKKGKNFYNISTMLAEPIQSMALTDHNIRVAGDHLYTHFIDNVDTHHYMSHERITDLLALKLPSSCDTVPAIAFKAEHSTILGGADRCIRVLEGSRCFMEVDLQEAPVVLCAFKDRLKHDGRVLYGTDQGSVGVVQLGKDGYRHIWMLDGADHDASITALASYALTEQSHRPEILVGRQDGTVSILSFTSEHEEDPPEEIFTTKLSNGIAAIAGARAHSRHHAEVVLGTFSGSVLALTTDPSAKGSPAGAQIAGTQSLSADADNLQELQNEVESLERELAQAQTKRQHLYHPDRFPIRHSFTLRPKLASSLLSIEAPVSIKMVLLSSNVPIDLLDVKDESAVTSFTPVEDGAGLNATYRCQPGVSNLQIKVRSIEGQSGNLHVYVMLDVADGLTHAFEYPIRTLALHQRSTSRLDENKPISHVTITGGFSCAQVNGWLQACLAEVPSQAPENSVAYTFKSTYLNTSIQTTFKPGEIKIASDNWSSACILKDSLMKAATAANLRVDVEEYCHPDGAVYVLSLLDPILLEQIELTKQVEVIQALKELETQEGSAEALTPEYADILNNADDLLARYHAHPCHLERLYGIVTDLHIDCCKAKGKNGRTQIPSLIQQLNDYDFAQLCLSFQDI